MKTPINLPELPLNSVFSLFVASPNGTHTLVSVTENKIIAELWLSIPNTEVEITPVAKNPNDVTKAVFNVVLDSLSEAINAQ